MGDKKNDKKKRSGLLSRLFKLVLFLAVLTGAGLVVGFKFQKPIKLDEVRTIETGKWVWEDTDGFLTYAKYWTGWTKDRLVEFDQQVGASDKAKQAAKKTGELAKQGYDKVKEEITDDGQPDAASGTSPDLDAQRDKNYGYTDAQLDQTPEGYQEAWLAGMQAFQEANEHYMRFTKDRDNNFHRENAIDFFKKAQEHFEDAQEIDPTDARPQQVLGEIQGYIHDLGKDATLDY